MSVELTIKQDETPVINREVRHLAYHATSKETKVIAVCGAIVLGPFKRDPSIMELPKCSECTAKFPHLRQ